MDCLGWRYCEGGGGCVWTLPPLARARGGGEQSHWHGEPGRPDAWSRRHHPHGHGQPSPSAPPPAPLRPRPPPPRLFPLNMERKQIGLATQGRLCRAVRSPLCPSRGRVRGRRAGGAAIGRGCGWGAPLLAAVLIGEGRRRQRPLAPWASTGCTQGDGGGTPRVPRSACGCRGGWGSSGADGGRAPAFYALPWPPPPGKASRSGGRAVAFACAHPPLPLAVGGRRRCAERRRAGGRRAEASAGLPASAIAGTMAAANLWFQGARTSGQDGPCGM